MDFYKVGWAQFYIRNPAWKLWRKAKARAARIWNTITGRWYCEECHKTHGRRVIFYSLDGETALCFHGMTEYAKELAAETEDTAENTLRKLVAGCEHIGSGRADVTYQTRRLFKEEWDK